MLSCNNSFKPDDRVLVRVNPETFFTAARACETFSLKYFSDWFRYISWISSHVLILPDLIWLRVFSSSSDLISCPPIFSHSDNTGLGSDATSSSMFLILFL